MMLFNVAQKIFQPDGQIVNCYASGDEYFKYLHDKNGNIIIKNHETGYYSYAQYKDGCLLPTENIITEQLFNSLNTNVLEDLVTAKDIELPLKNIFPVAHYGSGLFNAPTSGTINGLVIFIRFSGEAEFSPILPTYANLFNDQTPGAVSMYNYFKETSYNKLFITQTFYPQSTSPTILSYQDSHPRGYYEPYNATTNSIGYKNTTERDAREHELVKNATNYIASQVSPTLNIDVDNDGNIDSVIFIVKGTSSGWGELLWPHQSDFYPQDASINGKKLWTYDLLLEITLEPSGISVPLQNDPGTLCHEMQHTIGFSDLYHYWNFSQHPVGIWDIMDTIVTTPPQYSCAYMKFRYGKWIDNIPTITTSGTYTLNPLTLQTGNAFRINTSASSTEYFIVEYRRKLPVFEVGLPGSGLLVYRINTARDGKGNSDPSNPSTPVADEVYLYRPGGTTTSEGNYNLAFLSSESGRTSIGGPANPLFLSNGTPTEVVISNVGSAGDTISFNVSTSQTADLTISKSGPAPVIYPDDTFDYKLVIKNDSTVTATNVVVTDNLPSNLQFMYTVSTKGTCSNTGNKVTCTVGDMLPGEVVTITITVKAIKVGTIFNTANVSANNFALRHSNTVTTNIFAPSLPILKINKYQSKGQLYVGETLEYEVVVTNNSSNPADKVNNIVVTDDLPADSQFISASSTQGICSNVGNKVTCNIGTLNGATSATITIKLKTLKPGTLSNKATVTADGIEPMNSNTVNATVITIPVPTITINKIGPTKNIYVGDTFQYSIVVTNTSLNQANNVIVTDNLPNDCQFVSATSTKGTCSNIGNKVTCNIGILNAGEIVTITITVKTLRPATLSNTATVTAEGVAPIISNTVTTTIVNPQVPTITIVKRVSCLKVCVGQRFRYMIFVENNSNAKATNVIIEDYLPYGTELRYAESTKGICSNVGNKLTCNIGDLNPHERVMITIIVEALHHGMISNIAVVKADNMIPVDSNPVTIKVLKLKCCKQKCCKVHNHIDEKCHRCTTHHYNECTCNPCSHKFNADAKVVLKDKRCR